jgi:hypothetical protein
MKTALIRSTVVLVVAAITDCTSGQPDSRSGQKSTETYTEPSVVTSSGGVLRVTLTPRLSMVTVA